MIDDPTDKLEIEFKNLPADGRAPARRVAQIFFWRVSFPGHERTDTQLRQLILKDMRYVIEKEEQRHEKNH